MISLKSVENGDLITGGQVSSITSIIGNVYIYAGECDIVFILRLSARIMLFHCTPSIPRSFHSMVCWLRCDQQAAG